MLKSSQLAEQVKWLITSMLPLTYIFLLSEIIWKTRVKLSYRPMRLFMLSSWLPTSWVHPKLNKRLLTMNPLLRVNFFNHSSSNLCQFAHSMFSCIGQYADLHFAERNFSLKYSRNRLEKNNSGTSLHKKGVSMANLAGIWGLEAREKVRNIRCLQQAKFDILICQLAVPRPH